MYAIAFPTVALIAWIFVTAIAFPSPSLTGLCLAERCSVFHLSCELSG